MSNILTDNSSESSGYVKCLVGGEVKSSPDHQPSSVPNSVSDNSHIHHYAVDDRPLNDHETEMEQSIVQSSNCDKVESGQADNIAFNKPSAELNNGKVENIIEISSPDVDKVGSNKSEKTSFKNFDNGVESTLETDTERIFSSASNQRSTRQKPGVILLGRGNSFSLGRSEVIVLHHRPKSSKNKLSDNRGINPTREERLLTIDERRMSVEKVEDVKLNVTGGILETESSDYPNIPSSSPPPISNGMYHPDSQRTPLNGDNLNGNSSSQVIELVPCYEDDVQDLWRKAESMMALKNDKVCKILEEFGIGEPGGGGGEDETYWENEDEKERKREEEEVWQIIQGNYQV